MIRYSVAAMVAIAACCLIASPAVAQQIFVETPNTTVSDSFYENLGVDFGFSLGGGDPNGTGSRVVGLNPFGQPLGQIVFSQGGAGSAIPPFGGFDPNAGARTGFAVRNGNGGGFSLGLNLNQGSSRTLTTTTPGVTVQNGFGGSIFNGSVSPFVTGVVPVVGNGNGGVIDNGTTRALNSGQLDLSRLGQEGSHASRSNYVASSASYAAPSTAETAMASVDSIKAARQVKEAAKKSALDNLIKQVFEAEEAGDFLKARSLLRKAIKQCDEPDKKKLLRRRLTSLRGK